MKNFTIPLKTSNDFVAAWLIDAVANSAYKGVETNRLKAADFLSEAREMMSSDHPNSEFTQSKLNRLAARIAMHEEQQVTFEEALNAATTRWCEITGKPAWKPYSAGNATPMDKTATNAFFNERLG